MTQNIRSLQIWNLNKDFKSMGAFGIGKRNERGDCLIEFAEEHKLVIANRLLQKEKKKTNNELRSHQMEKQESR